ncbi:MAG: hypothetical protein IJE88_07580 [Akkermansia sp.]|nr:hypothetical protein [Akkermansia sp.]
MTSTTFFLTKVVPIIHSIPLQEKELQGWLVLYKIAAEKDIYDEYELCRFISLAILLAQVTLTSSYHLLNNWNSGDEKILTQLINQIHQSRASLKRKAQAFRESLIAEEDEPSQYTEIPEELEESEVIQYWMKRSKMMISYEGKEARE